LAAVATLAPGTAQPPIYRVPLVLRGKVIAGEAGHSVYGMTIKNMWHYSSTLLIVIPYTIKTISVQAWTGPEASRNPRPSDFDKVKENCPGPDTVGRGGGGGRNSFILNLDHRFGGKLHDSDA